MLYKKKIKEQDLWYHYFLLAHATKQSLENKR